jgi:hypothetical protein
VRPALRLLSLLAVAAASLVAPGTTAAADCPTTSFLRYGYLVYASKAVPDGVSLPRGAALGTGVADDPVESPADDAKCGREQADVELLRLAGVDPKVAVAVSGRPGSVFVLGGRCSGFAGDSFWACLTEPVTVSGTAFTGVAYPPGADRSELPLGRSLGTVQLGGEPANAVAIDGVDPAVAIGIEGRPSEAYVAPGVCPYERFANEAAGDDLKRCLSGPVWLVFDPPGARVGEPIVAHTDREVDGPAAGAAIQVVRATTTADVVPDNTVGGPEIATLPAGPAGTEIEFDVPDVAEGVYEAVVVCDGCASAFGGRTDFPVGSLVAFERGSQLGKVIALVIVALFIVLAVASIVLWRRGYAFKRRRRPA